jgi:hypothetical protein
MFVTKPIDDTDHVVPSPFGDLHSVSEREQATAPRTCQEVTR